MASYFRWRPHPWHGLSVGPDAPRVVHAYIEMTPDDTVKYEIDKATGYLRLDRPQRYTSQLPALYGFIPQTYCGDKVAALAQGVDKGDGDPLDICVLSERSINRAEILLNARVIGGLRMIDGGEADDKIVAVLDGDLVWGQIEDLAQAPQALIERIKHYFLTYKTGPGKVSKIEIQDVYGYEGARQVILAAMEDYTTSFGHLHQEG